jgi:hypothetical protein
LFVEIAGTLRSKLGNNAQSSGVGQCGAPNVQAVGKSSPVAGTATREPSDISVGDIPCGVGSMVDDFAAE